MPSRSKQGHAWNGRRRGVSRWAKLVTRPPPPSQIKVSILSWHTGVLCIPASKANRPPTRGPSRDARSSTGTQDRCVHPWKSKKRQSGSWPPANILRIDGASCRHGEGLRDVPPRNGKRTLLQAHREDSRVRRETCRCGNIVICGRCLPRKAVERTRVRDARTNLACRADACCFLPEDRSSRLLVRIGRRKVQNSVGKRWKTSTLVRFGSRVSETRPSTALVHDACTRRSFGRRIVRFCVPTALVMVEEEDERSEDSSHGHGRAHLPMEDRRGVGRGRQRPVLERTKAQPEDGFEERSEEKQRDAMEKGSKGRRNARWSGRDSSGLKTRFGR